MKNQRELFTNIFGFLAIAIITAPSVAFASDSDIADLKAQKKDKTAEIKSNKQQVKDLQKELSDIESGANDDLPSYNMSCECLPENNNNCSTEELLKLHVSTKSKSACEDIYAKHPTLNGISTDCRDAVSACGSVHKKLDVASKQKKIEKLKADGVELGKDLAEIKTQMEDSGNSCAECARLHGMASGGAGINLSLPQVGFGINAGGNGMGYGPYSGYTNPYMACANYGVPCNLGWQSGSGSSCFGDQGWSPYVNGGLNLNLGMPNMGYSMGYPMPSAGFNAGINPGFNGGIYPNMGYPMPNAGFNAGINPGFNAGIYPNMGYPMPSAGFNAGINPGFNGGIYPNMGYPMPNAGFNAGINPYANVGINPYANSGINPYANTGFNGGFNTGYNTGVNPQLMAGPSAQTQQQDLMIAQQQQYNQQARVQQMQGSSYYGQGQYYGQGYGNGYYGGGYGPSYGGGGGIGVNVSLGGLLGLGAAALFH